MSNNSSSKSPLTKPNLTTCIYHSNLGLAALTWSRNFIGRSLHIDLRFNDQLSNSLSSSSSSSSSVCLQINPFLFWKKQGSKKLDSTSITRRIEIYWDLTKAKFGSSLEPKSGFYVAVIVNGEMTLLVGDCQSQAYKRTEADKLKKTQVLILRREHVLFGTSQLYTTKARFGGKTRDISIDCSINGDDEPGLCFSVDEQKVLEIKRLKWKFRGHERIEVDGIPIEVSWDVYNWLFKKGVDEQRNAVFMFRFEKLGFDDDDDDEMEDVIEKSNGLISCGFGMSGFERCKLNKRSFKTRSSSLSMSSMSSSVSSACSSSVMEWPSTDENELETSTSGFSLLVYAWKN